MTGMNNNILLVEDDEALAQLTSQYLESNGFQVNTTGDGISAVEMISDSQPDLVILDLMLPGLDGMDVCKRVRPEYRGPILMYTAKTEGIDEILGLEMGADDYISKPVEPRLLLARVRALLRRATPLPATERNKRIEVNGLVVNDSARSVHLHETEVVLSNAEYDLLWLLASHAGDILSRKAIFENLRGIDYDGCNRAIDINISRIRSKLNDNPVSPEIIKTIRNKGYLMTK
jgi:two-component system response regulator RstA